MPRRKVHRMTNAILYADVLTSMRRVQRMQPEYAELKARTLLAMLRTQPGYEQAATGKNKLRVRWFLRTVPQLPHDAVLQYLPSGVIGAVLLLRSVLPRRCTWLPRTSLDQLCLLVLELAPAVVMQQQALL